MEGEISTIEKRKKLLKFFYDKVNGRLNTSLNIDRIKAPEFLKCGIKGWDEFKDITSYILEEKYIKFEDDTHFLTSKGINEVERGFPTLDPKSTDIFELRDILLGLGKKDDRIHSKLEEMQKWEDIFNRIDTQMELIKAQLDQVLAETEDEEIKRIIRDVIGSKSATQFISGVFRLAIHPKTKEYMKSIIGIEIASREIPQLPGRII